MHSSIFSHSLWLYLLFLLIIFGSGCGVTTTQIQKPISEQTEQPYSLKEQILKQKQLFLAKNPANTSVLMDSLNKDYVLENMIFSKAAIDAREMELAEEAIKRIMLKYQTITVNEVEKGRTSLIWQESARYFKGESYERANVFFYYGLLKLMDGDVQAARQAFYAAIVADTAYSESFSHDNALHYYFLGLACRELGDFGNATGAFKNCIKHARDQLHPTEIRVAQLGLPETNLINPDMLKSDFDSNVIILVELGYSPNKLADGLQNQKWKLYQLTCKAKNAKVSINQSFPQEAICLSDLFYQATTNGRDEIKKGFQDSKAFIKDLAPHIPYGLGIPLMFWEIEADPRTWTNLPAQYFVYALHVEEMKTPSIVLSFYDSDGKELKTLRQFIDQEINPNKLNIILTKFYSVR